MPKEFDAEALKQSLDGLRLARISNEIEGVREHPDDSPLLEAFARGEITGDDMLGAVKEQIAGARRKHA